MNTWQSLLAVAGNAIRWSYPLIYRVTKSSGNSIKASGKKFLRQKNWKFYRCDTVLHTCTMDNIQHTNKLAPNSALKKRKSKKLRQTHLGNSENFAPRNFHVQDNSSN